MLHGQILYDRGDPFIGSLKISGYESRKDLAHDMAGSAFRTNMKPPSKWLFWRHQWPDDVMVEYEKLKS